MGLKCGRSAGFSAITANPLLGRLSDYINSLDGSTELTEVPEMFGAQSLLMQRAANEEVLDKIVDLINHLKQYFIQHNQPVHENTSPTNKAGSISNLEDKLYSSPPLQLEQKP
ncbi:UxaA family hydrolase [Bacillus mojavensis]|nr:UxaA family hydrolase [Bacillus mojavensis]